MAFLVPNEGEDFMLEKIVNYTDIASQDLILRLYENNETPGETDTVGTYTEVTDGSYAAKTLTGSSWVISDGAGSYAQQAYTIATTQVVYGYYITNFAGTILVLAERFASTINIGVGGGTVNLTPTVNLD